MTSLTAPRVRLTLGAVFLGVLGLTMLLLRRLAHADTGSPVPPETNWPTTIALILGGIATLLAGLSVVLHAVAPRTKTTVDDKLADSVDAAHTKLDEVLAALRKLLGPGAILVLLAMGGVILLGCTPAQRTTAGNAMVDCTAASAGAIGGTLASMRGDCFTPATEAVPAKTDWGCVRGKAIAAGLQVGGCAFVELVSAEFSAARVASATGEAPPVRPGRAAFESYRASVAGGATFRTDNGDR